MEKFTMMCGWFLGFFPFKWNSATEKYVLGSQLQRNLSALSIGTTVISAIISARALKIYVLPKFISKEIDAVLNLIIIYTSFATIILISCIFYIKHAKVLILLNRVLYLKKLILKLNQNPFLDTKLVQIFLLRCVFGMTIFIFIELFTVLTAVIIEVESFAISIIVTGFALHYSWYTAAVSSLLCCTLFAAHLVRVITIEMNEISSKLQRINRIVCEIKPGQYLNELCELSERIDYLKYCYYEVISFVRMTVKMSEFTFLLITGNIFVSIISDIGHMYLRLFTMPLTNKTWQPIMIIFGYFSFALNELFFMTYGSQKLLKRVSNLEKVVGSAPMIIVKGDNRVGKSVSFHKISLMNSCLHELNFFLRLKDLPCR